MRDHRSLGQLDKQVQR